MRMKVSVSGLRELDTALGQLSKATARNTLRRVLMRAGEPIAEEARRLAPKDTGELADSIAVSPKLINPAGAGAFAAVMRAGGSKGEAVQAMRDARREAGSSFAEVYVGPGKAPTKADSIKRIVTEFGGKNHRPQPYMRPAFDARANEALEIIKRDLGSEIDKAARRAARRAAKKAAG